MDRKGFELAGAAREGGREDMMQLRARMEEFFDLPKKLSPDPLIAAPRRSGRRAHEKIREWEELMENIRRGTAPFESWRGVDKALIRVFLVGMDFRKTFSRDSLFCDEKTGEVVFMRRAEGAPDFTQIRFAPEKGALKAKRFSRELRPGSLPYFEHDGKSMAEFLSGVFGVSGFTYTTEKDRPSGMTFYGMPAHLIDINAEFLVKNREDILSVIGLFKVVAEIEKGVGFEINTLASAISSPEGARKYHCGEASIHELVAVKASEAIISFLAENPDVNATVRDFNVRVEEAKIVPGVCYRRSVPFFGHPIEETYTKELDPIDLPAPFPYLFIDSFAVRKGGSKMEVSLPQKYRLKFKFWFFPWDEGAGDDRRSFNLKEKFVHKIIAWRSANFKTEEPPREVRAVKDLNYFLALIGLKKEDLLEKSPADQEKVVKSRLRELSHSFHPDHAPREIKGEQRAAGELMKEINEAREFFQEIFKKK